MIFQIAEDFYSDITHHVGFPLRPFNNLLCIHGYHPTLYTAEPPLSGHLLSSHPPLAASNQCSEIIVEKNGKLNLYWAATSIKRSRPPFCCYYESFAIFVTSIKRP